jgi:hypothetical protein
VETREARKQETEAERGAALDAEIAAAVAEAEALSAKYVTSMISAA